MSPWVSILIFVGGVVLGFTMHHWTRWKDMQALTRALSLEMLQIRRALDNYRERLVVWEEESDHMDVGPTPPALDIKEGLFAIYSANLSKLGLMEEGFLLSTIKFYQGVRELMRENFSEWGERAEWHLYFEDYCNRVSQLIEKADSVQAHMLTFANMSLFRWKLEHTFDWVEEKKPGMVKVTDWIRSHLLPKIETRKERGERVLRVTRRLMAEAVEEGTKKGPNDAV